MRKLISLLALVPALAHAENFELVYSAPIETTLQNPDIRAPQVVWCEMFSAAKKKIDLAEMYISTDPKGPELEEVLACLESASKRGVKIRFLIEEKMLRATGPVGRARIEAIAGLKLEVIDWSRIHGDGIVHAKYIIVDDKDAFLGSQNFDWRALRHIHETGVRIKDAKIVKQMQAVFAQDWADWQSIKKGKKAKAVQQSLPRVSGAANAYLVASPWSRNPKGVADSETELVRLIGDAKESVRVVVMDYYPLDRKKRFYAPIDNALRAAAVRGVKLQLTIANWSAEPGQVEHLKSLALLPNVEIKISSIPEAKEGFIPFARVVHSKFMVIDRITAWVGTSNWTGGYLDNSRNLELVVKDEAFVRRLSALQEQLWLSVYAEPLRVDKEYKAVKKF